MSIVIFAALHKVLIVDSTLVSIYQFQLTEITKRIPLHLHILLLGCFPLWMVTYLLAGAECRVFKLVASDRFAVPRKGSRYSTSGNLVLKFVAISFRVHSSTR